jgi:uncharacterized protein (DUF885 family)
MRTLILPIAAAVVLAFPVADRRSPIAVSPATAPSRTARDSTPESRRLAAIADTVWQYQRATSLSLRMEMGLPIDSLPDLSLAGAQREGAAAERMLARVREMTDRGLSQEERITLRVLRWQLALAAEAPRYYWLSLASVTPYATPLNDVVRAFSAARLASADDAARYGRLLAQAAPFVDSMRAGLEARAAKRIRLPRDEIPLVVATVRAYRKGPAESPFVPAAERLERLDAAARQRLRETAARVVTSDINPAIDRFVAYVEGAYRAEAPTTVGQWQYPGGRDFYRWLVKQSTTMEVTPAEVHAIGLREVARLDSAMAAIRREVGFTGTPAEFHESLRRDPRFHAKSPEEVRALLMSYVARIEPRVSDFFGRVPRARGDARRLDPRLEPAMTFGYYSPPSAADPMGHYYFNGSKLDERSTITAAPLIYHELIPGHHFQITLQKENTALPPLRRNQMDGAFVEGWGDYASALAGEMGMYRDPYERYGRLFMEMFLACRLVVDTGMNEYGWPRDSAMAFMRPRVAESAMQLETETLRYSVDLPGQALAYRMGAIELRRLREEARAASGARFDVRAFHDAVLGSGSLPMAVLRERLGWWIEDRKNGTGG